MARLTKEERAAHFKALAEDEEDDEGEGEGEGGEGEGGEGEEADEFTYRGVVYRRVADESGKEGAGKAGEKTPKETPPGGDGAPPKRRRFIT